MKKTLYQLFLYILAFSFSTAFFDGITLPGTAIYWLLTTLSFAIVIMAHKPILKFLTVNNNFVTMWLVGTILSFGIFYALEMVVPEFLIGESTFGGAQLELISINAFKMSKMLTMVSCSAVYAFVAAVMTSLGSLNEA